MTVGNDVQDPAPPTGGAPVSPPTVAEPPRGFTSTPTFSKILVIVLALSFVLGTAAFMVSASGAKKEKPAPTTPVIPVKTGAGAATDTGAIDAPTDVAAAAPGDVQLALAILQDPSPSPAPSIDPLASPDPLASVDPFASPDPSFDPNASPDPLSLMDPAAIVELQMPMVPVVGFWGTQDSISKADLVAALKGQSSDWDRVLIPTGDRAAIEAALGITTGTNVEEASPDAIASAVRLKKKDVLGILRASDVPIRVRTLAIGGADLFGNERIRNLDNWPFTATVQGPAGSAWNQKATWTLVAGGDSFTDRGIYERVVNRNKGIDYPFDGGTANVTGHYCCGPFVDGYQVPRYKLGGPKGIVRDMTKNADLAIVNHESPIPNNWVFHLHGFAFSGKPELTQIFTRAGIDFMSIANNHIRDFGADGIADTRANLDKYGIKYAGAGKDLTQAGQVAYLTTHGVKIGIVSCDAIGPSIFAGDSYAGVLPCKNKYVLPRIKEAKANADFVIVFPHWGVEYSRAPLDKQRKWAAKWIKAGADMITGAHSHVAGAIEEIEGKPVFYSMGNFIFDQNWRTETMESFLIEATFQGKKLVNLRLHPFLSHDQAQPNFLDPAKDDGKALMKSVRNASFIDW
ncbi:MAG: CapA family protein [Chloroflexota bacterium]